MNFIKQLQQETQNYSHQFNRIEEKVNQIMTAINDLNTAVTTLSAGFQSLDTAVQAELTAILNANTANDPAIETAVSNIGLITASMAKDAASINTSLTSPTPGVSGPLSPPETAPAPKS